MRLCRDRDMYKEFISAESLSELPQNASRWSNIAEIFPHHDEGVLPRGGHRKTRETHLQNV